MESFEAANLALVREYLSALERGETGHALARFFTEDAIQEELPNRLNPNGGRSDLATILERSERGAQLLESQRYVVRSAIARGSEVAVEAEWSATVAAPVGTIPAGGAMRAYFAMFFECVRRERSAGSATTIASSRGSGDRHSSSHGMLTGQVEPGYRET